MTVFDRLIDRFRSFLLSCRRFSTEPGGVPRADGGGEGGYGIPKGPRGPRREVRADCAGKNQ